MTFSMGNPGHESSQVALSESLSSSSIAAVVATTSSHYSVNTEAWTYPAPQGASPVPFPDSMPVPAPGSGNYPSDAEWSAGRNSFSHSPASGFDLPMHDAGMGSHGYNTPYDYPYHNDFEAAASSLLETTSASTNPSSYRRASKTLEPSASTRSRRRYPLSPPPPPPSAKSAAASKLRSASRASKNNHLNPPATEEERKNRASHNQVEKQYRNRLNAHFEALLNTLPQYMRGGEDEEEDDGDRKISKAEVLEMARRHILNLERELTSVEDERDELKDNVERLRWFMARSEKGNDKSMSSLAAV